MRFSIALRHLTAMIVYQSLLDLKAYCRHTRAEKMVDGEDEQAATAVAFLWGIDRRPDYVFSRSSTCQRLRIQEAMFMRMLWETFDEEEQGILLDLMDSGGIRFGKEMAA